MAKYEDNNYGQTRMILPSLINSSLQGFWNAKHLIFSNSH